MIRSLVLSALLIGSGASAANLSLEGYQKVVVDGKKAIIYCSVAQRELDPPSIRCTYDIEHPRSKRIEDATPREALAQDGSYHLKQSTSFEGLFDLHSVMEGVVVLDSPHPHVIMNRFEQTTVALGRPVSTFIATDFEIELSGVRDQRFSRTFTSLKECKDRGVVRYQELADHYCLFRAMPISVVDFSQKCAEKNDKSFQLEGVISCKF